MPTFLKSSYSYDVEQRCSQYVFSEEYTYESDLLFDECLSASNFEKGGPKRVRLKSATGYYHGVEIEPLGPVDGSSVFGRTFSTPPTAFHLAGRLQEFFR